MESSHGWSLSSRRTFRARLLGYYRTTATITGESILSDNDRQVHTLGRSHLNSRDFRINHRQSFLDTFRRLQPALFRRTENPNTQIFVPKTLNTFTHVILRHDAIRRPLAPTYDGPFKVQRRGAGIYCLTHVSPRLSPPQRVREIFLTTYPQRAVFADEVPQTPYCLESRIRRLRQPAARPPAVACPRATPAVVLGSLFSTVSGIKA
ncbi:hypothetical protein AAG570_010820 [Ranatra chinensis]|uniref:Uncharacterized protein n=1 Tax=Ranatra chinensis TaxID=642074 RepID=A0ABD0YV27_9HEMI